MKKTNEKIKFLISLSKTQAILVKRFEGGLGNGLGFNEFLILFYLNQARGKQMRRVDLADKISLTASGVTRLLLPMEKIGLVKSGPAADDARVRFVAISKSGQDKIEETLDRLNHLIEEILSSFKKSDIKRLSDLLSDICGKFLMT